MSTGMLLSRKNRASDTAFITSFSIPKMFVWMMRLPVGSVGS